MKTKFLLVFALLFTATPAMACTWGYCIEQSYTISPYGVRSISIVHGLGRKASYWMVVSGSGNVGAWVSDNNQYALSQVYTNKSWVSSTPSAAVPAPRPMSCSCGTTAAT